MNIVILGNGYVAKHLKAALTANTTHTVTTIRQIDIDYTNREKFNTLLAQQPNSTIAINCAGFTGTTVDACELPTSKKLCVKLNTVVPGMMAHACRELSIPFFHVSSGCIYDGYHKIYNETDEPNFGIYAANSSFYSKTKHLGELNVVGAQWGSVFRIRMPFCNTLAPKNLLVKLSQYTHIISQENSMTSICDFCSFIEKFIDKQIVDRGEIYNVVNPGYVSPASVRLMIDQKRTTNNWTRIADTSTLNLLANRSNCMLDSSKIQNLGLGLPPVIDSLEKCIDGVVAAYNAAS